MQVKAEAVAAAQERLEATKAALEQRREELLAKEAQLKEAARAAEAAASAAAAQEDRLRTREATLSLSKALCSVENFHTLYQDVRAMRKSLEFALELHACEQALLCTPTAYSPISHLLLSFLQRRLNCKSYALLLVIHCLVRLCWGSTETCCTGAGDWKGA